MKNSTDFITGTTISYRLLMLGCIVIVELSVLAVFKWWPLSRQDDKEEVYVPADQEAFLEDVQITTQKGLPPPPPKPMVPVVVPNDEIVEETTLPPQDVNLSINYDPLSTDKGGQGGSGDKIASNPELPPSIVRIVEPTVPEAARRADVKAEIWVSFLVDKQGKVQEATIEKIKLYDKDGKNYKVVDTIGYGLVQATIEAALQWKFRPAKNKDEAVKAYTTHIFTYGF